jgi:hypothetical protein
MTMFAEMAVVSPPQEFAFGFIEALRLCHEIGF